MRNFFSKHDVGVKELLILGFVLLGVYTTWLHRQFLGRAYVGVAEKVVDKIPQASLIDRCGDDCQKEIDKKVAEALSTVSAKQSVNTTNNIGSERALTATKTSFVPVGAAFSSTNTDWTDVPGGEVFINPSDYGSTPKFYWEGSLKIANGSGGAHARLFDITNGIAVSGSEISTNSVDYKTVGSGVLPLWSGENQYKVQVKSTSSQQASFVSGKIRVIYK